MERGKMNQEQYWRNLISDEIRAEHDRVQAYYRKKGANSGGMSNEEHTRLNIFRLCESIARSMKGSVDAPRLPSTPEPVPAPVEPVVEKTAEEEIEELNSFIEEQVQEKDLIRNLVKDRPQQNQFGEFM